MIQLVLWRKIISELTFNPIYFSFPKMEEEKVTTAPSALAPPPLTP